MPNEGLSDGERITVLENRRGGAERERCHRLTESQQNLIGLVGNGCRRSPALTASPQLSQWRVAHVAEV